MIKPYKPHYPLNCVKDLVKANHYHFNDNALQHGNDCFGWGPNEMISVISRLNDRWHWSNPSKNHFFKTKPHTSFPNTKMDYYKIQNAPEGNMIYTHFYIHPISGQLIISSFKELEIE